MTRYQKYMQKIHSVGTASAVEMGVMLIIEDVLDHLIKSGVKADSPIIKEIRSLREYTYTTHA